jgi:hypothetical protein
MQNRYAGDIGDFVKLGILRALSPGYRLGVAWLFPDEEHKKDGRHICYLDQPLQWRHFDPQLFDALGEIVSSSQRDVRALEAANILAYAIFFNDVTPRQQQVKSGLRASSASSKGPISCSLIPTMGWNQMATVMAQQGCQEHPDQ